MAKHLGVFFSFFCHVPVESPGKPFALLNILCEVYCAAVFTWEYLYVIGIWRIFFLPFNSIFILALVMFIPTYGAEFLKIWACVLMCS